MKKDEAKSFEETELIALISNYGDIKKYSDRDAIIVLTSIIEEFLERLLKKQLCIPSNAVRDQLFSFDGPLGTFSNKIAMAFSIGAFSKDVYDDLNVLRGYRNECAHNIIHDEIDSKIFQEEKLSRLHLLNSSNLKDLEATEDEATNRFRLIIEVLCILTVLNIRLITVKPFEPPIDDYKPIVKITKALINKVSQS